MRRTRKRLIKLSAVGVAGLATIALAAVVLLPDPDPVDDPTRRGPTRHLDLTEARIDERPGATLIVRGRTNLVRGTRLEIAVLSGRNELVRLQAESDGEGFVLEAPAEGAIANGDYEVAATFRLEEQPDAVRGELGYQPAKLSARRRLALPLRLAKAGAVREQVRELFVAVNREPRDPTVIDDLDRRARELADRLWLGEEKTALLRLRQALQEARRPELRRQEFDRLILEAHVLAGL